MHAFDMNRIGVLSAMIPQPGANTDYVLANCRYRCGPERYSAVADPCNQSAALLHI